MIRVRTIHIEEFRGIRDLELDLDAKNFGICGPNGTGKSGVVDAIEFCLTGDVTRLSGQGSSGLSVKTHAPHVDQHNNPEKAKVTITAEIPSLGKTVTLHRSVKNPNVLKISPDVDDVKDIVEQLRMHPEFALSRREIIKYIITPPGKRSEDVQTLLRLDHIEKLRKSLTTFANKRKSEADEAERTHGTAEFEIKTTLKIDKLDRTLVLDKVNEKRKILNLEALEELKKDSSFKEGVAAPQDDQRKPVIRKTPALTDILAFQSAIKDGEPSGLVESREATKGLLEKLKEDGAALTLARRQGFIRTGLDLVTEDACPLCDKEWNADELREYLHKKLLSAEKLGKLVGELANKIRGVLASLSTRIQMIERIVEYCQKLEPTLDHTDLSAYLDVLQDMKTALTGFMEDHSQVEPALGAVSKSWWVPEESQQARIDKCEKAVKALPDTSAEDEAREVLTVAQDRYERLLNAAKASKERAAQCNIAQRILNHYNDCCNKVLEGIYDQVAKDFSRYYGIINREDEEAFVGELTSAPAKLSFNVDFYGRGLFPPGAYHSEGHQDGMGLCLYLALMKHTLGNKFTLAVLDDVLMSVDTGHRREVCRMLKMEFPHTQFLLTTHDRVWLQYMKTEGLISKSQSFNGWTVDTGPRVWDDHDIWTEIQSGLEKNNVANSAGLLRRYLEYSATVLADNLRAPVEFRGDGHYDLGDLLPRVLKEWTKKLEIGEKSAKHWNQKEEEKSLTTKRTNAKKLIAKTNTERWMINPSVHYNEWANFEKNEFQEVVDAFKELLESLQCENKSCTSFLYVSPPKGKAEEIRCNCGATSINLKIGN